MYRQTVIIVGVGALGSHLAQFLRNEANLFVIDFDRVEAKNVLSQFHGKPNVGKNKVTSLGQLTNYLWGHKVDGATVKLVDNNVDALLGREFRWPENIVRKADLIVDCLDNGAARRLVQAYVRKHNVPCLHGALAADGGFGRVIWDEHFQIDDEDAAGAPTCEDGAHLPFIAMVSAFLAKSAQTFLANGKRQGWSIAPTRIEMV
jgi:molybdopterin/thiamine biosynthesis adenylyltransferase